MTTARILRFMALSAFISLVLVGLWESFQISRGASSMQSAQQVSQAAWSAAARAPAPEPVTPAAVTPVETRTEVIYRIRLEAAMVNPATADYIMSVV